MKWIILALTVVPILLEKVYNKPFFDSWDSRFIFIMLMAGFFTLHDKLDRRWLGKIWFKQIIHNQVKEEVMSDSLTSCDDCNGIVSIHADSCPHCGSKAFNIVPMSGERLREFNWKIHGIFLIIIIASWAIGLWKFSLIMFIGWIWTMFLSDWAKAVLTLQQRIKITNYSAISDHPLEYAQTA